MTSLFDADLPPAYRATDPETAVAAGLARPVSRGTDRARALLALDAEPAGLTDFELAARLNRQQTSAGKRRGELRALGLVDATGRRRPAPSGAAAIVWAITAEGRAEAARLRALA
jgi:hypothetical protein